MVETEKTERFRFLGTTPDVRDEWGSEEKIFESVEGVRLPIGSKIEPDEIYKITYKDKNLGLDPVFGELYDIRKSLTHKFSYGMIAYIKEGGCPRFFPLETNDGKEFYRQTTNPCLVERATEGEMEDLVRSYGDIFY